jgi:hypothetical protein
MPISSSKTSAAERRSPAHRNERGRLKAALLAAVLCASSATGWAGEAAVFFNARYLALTRQLMQEVDPQVQSTFAGNPETLKTYDAARRTLDDFTSEIRGGLLFKRVDGELLSSVVRKR